MADVLMSLRVLTMDSTAFELRVSPEATVPAFKTMVSGKTGVSEARQRLIFQGKVLSDQHALSFYAMESGKTVHLVERPEGIAASEQALSRGLAASDRGDGVSEVGMSSTIEQMLNMLQNQQAGMGATTEASVRRRGSSRGQLDSMHRRMREGMSRTSEAQPFARPNSRSRASAAATGPGAIVELARRARRAAQMHASSAAHSAADSASAAAARPQGAGARRVQMSRTPGGIMMSLDLGLDEMPSLSNMIEAQQAERARVASLPSPRLPPRPAAPRTVRSSRRSAPARAISASSSRRGATYTAAAAFDLPEIEEMFSSPEVSPRASGSATASESTAQPRSRSDASASASATTQTVGMDARGSAALTRFNNSLMQAGVTLRFNAPEDTHHSVAEVTPEFVSSIRRYASRAQNAFRNLDRWAEDIQESTAVSNRISQRRRIEGRSGGRGSSSGGQTADMSNSSSRSNSMQAEGTTRVSGEDIAILDRILEATTGGAQELSRAINRSERSRTAAMRTTSAASAAAPSTSAGSNSSARGVSPESFAHMISSSLGGAFGGMFDAGELEASIQAAFSAEGAGDDAAMGSGAGVPFSFGGFTIGPGGPVALGSGGVFNPSLMGIFERRFTRRRSNNGRAPPSASSIARAAAAADEAVAREVQSQTRMAQARSRLQQAQTRMEQARIRVQRAEEAQTQVQAARLLGSSSASRSGRPSSTSSASVNSVDDSAAISSSSSSGVIGFPGRRSGGRIAREAVRRLSAGTERIQRALTAQRRMRNSTVATRRSASNSNSDTANASASTGGAASASAAAAGSPVAVRRSRRQRGMSSNKEEGGSKRKRS